MLLRIRLYYLRMKKEQFLTFQKFNDEAAVLELETILNTHNIEYILEDTSASFDPSFANSLLTKEFRIKLRKQDFEKTDSLLQQISLDHLDSVDKDYYLFGFTDLQLMELITKRDEWGQFDFLLAQKLLKERGKEIKPELIELLKKQRIEELAKPEENQTAWIYAGYITAFLSGFLGFFIGWHLATHKKTLPNGDRVYSYSQSDRRHGNRILIIGVIFFVFWLIIRIMTM
jgi:hypothetical protein